MNDSTWITDSRKFQKSARANIATGLYTWKKLKNEGGKYVFQFELR